MQHESTALQGRTLWSPFGRGIAFALSASSILCLLAGLYRLCSMGTFALYVFLPCLAALGGLAGYDRWRLDGQFCSAVMLGLAGGLVAAVSYDIFRLPFVFSQPWHLTGLVPPLNLFAVFPRFGAMLLNQPLDQANYSGAVQLTGWLYHFSNGATFGVMYVALIGRPAVRHWAWAVMLAIALEFGMLLTPYPRTFHIAVTPRFIAVTAAAHGIFGVILGLWVKWRANAAGMSRDQGLVELDPLEDG